MPPRKTQKKKDLILPDFTRYFFLVFVIAILSLFFWSVSPFFDVLVYSALIAIFTNPIYRFFLRLFKQRKNFAALVSTIITVLIVLIPIGVFAFIIAQEAVGAYQGFESNLVNFDLSVFDVDHLADLPYVGNFLEIWADKLGYVEFLNNVELDLFGTLGDIGETISTYIVSQTGNLVWGLGTTLLNVFILILTLFFFFRDGDDIIAFLKQMSPLPKEHENEIENKLKETTHGIVVGNFGTSVLQGIAGGIGFAIAGVDHVVFWITLMAFASLIPYVGAAIIWFPLAIAFLIQGNMWGLFLLIWGVFVVSSVDNIARPYLIGKGANMHPLATFLVVLGSMLLIGVKGIVFGPLILSLTITILHIYKLEYKDILKL